MAKESCGVVVDGGEENDFLVDEYREGQSGCPGAGLCQGGVTYDAALFEVRFGFAGLRQAHKENGSQGFAERGVGKGDVSGGESGDVGGHGEECFGGDVDGGIGEEGVAGVKDVGVGPDKAVDAGEIDRVAEWTFFGLLSGPGVPGESLLGGE
ncbi:hypothetical protein ES703_99006 [subsurface metagenome]